MLAVPEMLAPLRFCTVKVRSTVLPVVVLPKFVVAVGVTLKSAWATPLAAALQALSFPALSTAVIRAKYVVPALSDVTPVATIRPAVGAVVADGTVKNELLGQAGLDVAR
jgi:hypothetical protein